MSFCVAAYRLHPSSAALTGRIVCTGLLLCVAGYRLWKLLIFLIGFVNVGLLCSAVALMIDVGTCIRYQIQYLPGISSDEVTNACDTEVMLTSAERAFVVGGLIGGFLALCLCVPSPFLGTV